MRIIICFGVISLLLLASFLPDAKADVDIGVSIGDEGVKGFYFAVGDYYRVPHREIVLIRERRIPDYEMPVILFLAQRARVTPAVIVDLRLGGMTWLGITLHFGLSPEIYYVPVRDVRVYGPPYGKAYGYYKNKPRKEWKKIRLDDDDVINLVNLKFLSSYYNYKPETIIKMRSEDKSFISINDELKIRSKDKPRKREVDSGNIEFKDKGDKGGSSKGKSKNGHKKGGKD